MIKGIEKLDVMMKELERQEQERKKKTYDFTFSTQIKIVQHNTQRRLIATKVIQYNPSKPLIQQAKQLIKEIR